MSNTKKHKEKGKFNQGILNYEETDRTFQDYCDRQNNDYAEFRARRKSKLEKIIDKETSKILAQMKNIL